LGVERILQKAGDAGRSDAQPFAIVAVAEALRNNPYLGRAGLEPGIRELVVGGTLYVILYRVRGSGVVILTIWRGAPAKVNCELLPQLRLHSR
jgi:plasmid stabilization system protein ParE